MSSDDPVTGIGRFREFGQRVVFTMCFVAVIALLLAMVVLWGVFAAVESLIAIGLTLHVAMQVAMAPGLTATPRAPEFLAEPESPAQEGENDADDFEDDSDAPRHATHNRLSDWLLEQSERLQPDDEPTYRGYLIGPAWLDLVAIVVESWRRTWSLSRLTREVGRRHLRGKYRSYVLFPVSLAMAVGDGLTIVGILIVLLVMFLFCALFLIILSSVWFVAVVLFRAIESAIAGARGILITCPHELCAQRIWLATYSCDRCGAKHAHLTPNKFGLLWHPCHCGKRLATTLLLGKWRLQASCPHCKNLLPPGIGREPIKHIPMFGAPRAGKSTLYCLILKSWRQSMADDPDAVRFLDARDEATLGLNNGCAEMEKTNPGAALRPVLVSVQPPNRPRTLLYLYDPAGENVIGRYRAGQQVYFAYATSCLVAIDPFTIEALRPQREKPLPSAEAPMEMLGALEAALRSRAVDGKRQKIKRLGVVVTKSDRVSAHPLGESLTECHPDVRAWLRNMDLGAQLDALEKEAERVEYFASGLSPRCGCLDYKRLALWISGMTDTPWTHPAKDCSCPGTVAETTRPARLAQPAVRLPAGSASDDQVDTVRAIDSDGGLPRSYILYRAGLAVAIGAVSIATWCVLAALAWNRVPRFWF